MFDRIDWMSRSYVGMRVLWVLALLIALVLGGAMVGWLFPKFKATAMLQFPEQKWEGRMHLPDPLLKQQLEQNEKGNVIELQMYKRVAASYNASAQLARYLDATSQRHSAAAERLLRQSENPGFWDEVAVPLLPFSRRDQKEFGDVKDANANSLLGLELNASARTAPVAEQMVPILADYFTNAVMRERIRYWVLAGKVELSTEKTARADILRAELDIELSARRAQDMKAILARYPEASRMEARQVVSINAADGGERFLSPLAQLVGAESTISQRRELIRRMERDLHQKELLSQFYSAAEPLMDQQPDGTKLLAALKELADRSFSKVASREGWAKEATLRVYGALEGFSAMRSQFGVRGGVRVEKAPGRHPLRLALFGAALGVVLLGGLGLLRTSLGAVRSEEPNNTAR